MRFRRFCAARTGCAQCAHLIIVSNEVFRGGADYAGDHGRVSAGAGADQQRAGGAGGERLPRCLRHTQMGEGRKRAWSCLETVCVAFAMFSALPVPHVDWNERNMRYAMAAFPARRAVIGALWCVCGLLPLPDMLKAAGFA